jgi:predicted amidohydrolase
MARIAMGQMLVEGGAVQANLARAEEFIARAAGEGCDVIVLPECLDTGWTHPSAREQAHPIPGPVSHRLTAAAARHAIHVSAGITERCGDRIYNAAVLLSPAGAVVAHHRKINELDIAHHLYSRGDRLMVADTPFGKVGLTICADNFPDSLDLSRSLARMGARYILSPCAWAVDASHDNIAEPCGDLWRGAYTTLTAAHAVTIVGVSNVGWLAAGPWKGRKCIGCSMAMGPGGAVLAQGPYGDSAQGRLRPGTVRLRNRMIYWGHHEPLGLDPRLPPDRAGHRRMARQGSTAASHHCARTRHQPLLHRLPQQQSQSGQPCAGNAESRRSSPQSGNMGKRGAPNARPLHAARRLAASR